MRRGLLLAAAALVLLAAPPLALADANEPVYNDHGQLIESPITPDAPRSSIQLSEEKALALFEHDPKIAGWLKRYDQAKYAIPPTNAAYDAKTGLWTAQIFADPAGEIATGKVEDTTGRVTEAWTGPQVAWTMSRCQAGWSLWEKGCGAFGGGQVNTPWIWIAFSLIFIVGLLDYGRLLSIRTLDLVMLVGPLSASLWFFNNGEIFTSVPLVYPSLAYLFGRMLWIGFKGHAPRARTLWPTWLFVALAVFIGGYRIGEDMLPNTTVDLGFAGKYSFHGETNVIDVGFAGVIGAQRIVHDHRAPYGNFPTSDSALPGCGPADASGAVRAHVQTNGRCEDANGQGDTYGPVSYEAYVPGYLLFGWKGRWATEDLHAANFTSILFDLLCALGLVLVGKRFGGNRLAAILAFAWFTYPFTNYTLSSNTNDAIPPAFLLFGVWLMHKPAARGIFLALAGWTKFAPLLAAGLWLGHPSGWRSKRPGDFIGGFLLATGAAFSILLLEPSFLHALRAFWDRTIAWQLDRPSPFSIWDWRQYHAGLPDLHFLQRPLEGALALFALALTVWPRRRSPLQLVAFTGALLVGFELLLTHWFYLYVVWFFPFVAIALLAGGAPAVARVEEPEDDHELREPAVVA